MTDHRCVVEWRPHNLLGPHPLYLSQSSKRARQCECLLRDTNSFVHLVTVVTAVLACRTKGKLSGHHEEIRSTMCRAGSRVRLSHRCAGGSDGLFHEQQDRLTQHHLPKAAMRSLLS